MLYEDKLGAHHELPLERLVLDVVKLDEVGYHREVGMASDAPAEDGLGSVDVHRHRVREVVHQARVPGGPLTNDVRTGLPKSKCILRGFLPNAEKSEGGSNLADVICICFLGCMMYSPRSIMGYSSRFFHNSDDWAALDGVCKIIQNFL